MERIYGFGQWVFFHLGDPIWETWLGEKLFNGADWCRSREEHARYRGMCRRRRGWLL
jgi:hypothetical protein